MAKVTGIVGAKAVIANIKQRTARIGAGFSRGVTLAGLHLQKKSMEQVPVDTGNLKASAFTRRFGIAFGTEVVVGYTAAYALYVHEAKMVLKGQKRPSKPDTRENPGYFWDPQGQAKSKFLSDPANTERVAMREIIKRSIQLS